MSDTLDEDHAQAVLSLLSAALGAVTPPIPVFEGGVSNPTPDPPRYVVVYPVITWPADADGTPLNSQQVTISASFYCHSAAADTAAAARAVGMQVRAALLNVRPVVANRVCGLIRQSDSAPEQRDDSTGRAVFRALSVYSFTSYPG